MTIKPISLLTEQSIVDLYTAFQSVKIDRNHYPSEDDGRRRRIANNIIRKEVVRLHSEEIKSLINDYVTRLIIDYDDLGKHKTSSIMEEIHHKFDSDCMMLKVLTDDASPKWAEVRYKIAFDAILSAFFVGLASASPEMIEKLNTQFERERASKMRDKRAESKRPEIEGRRRAVLEAAEKTGTKMADSDAYAGLIAGQVERRTGRTWSTSTIRGDVRAILKEQTSKKSNA